MTICIAALCDEGKSCIVAADRMGVFGAGSLLEFKQDDSARKIHKLDEQTVLLHSGSMQDSPKIVDAFQALESNEDASSRLDEALAKLLREQREIQIRRSIGGEFNYEKLMASVTAAPAGPFRDLWEQLQKLNMGDMLLVAPDGDGYAIYFHSSPNFAIKSDLHYFAVGSGGIYARAALTIQQYTHSCDLASALFRVYTAKKAAELVYGVGEPTDMAILTPYGFNEVAQDTIQTLESIRTERETAILTNDQTSKLKSLLGVAEQKTSKCVNRGSDSRRI